MILYTPILMRMSEADRRILIIAIATKEGTAEELSIRYGYTIKELRSFVDDNIEEITKAREAWEREESTSDTTPDPNELEKLWIASKAARLKKMQNIADRLYRDCMVGGFDAATLREFRSYCQAAANELGQLLHRGSGEAGDDTLNVDIQGVDFERLR